ncbi:DUF2726 domain-containing protein [Thiocystis violacea]|uniref:DUF2726 domain-containing protein n=1 Tax=Thiocystis violacea TaxID=13725 RepID=UPI0019052EEA|nr:DUF2726 domain-containing protein [Thiocystis violacea]MBK1719584.1 hypothetical protein [Thiocystis violacea]
MEHFYFLIGLGVLVLLAFILSLRASLKRGRRLPYVADKTLFSPTQRAFMAVLERAVGKEYRIHGKVRAADVIGLSSRLSRRDRERAYDRLGDRRFDFLICDGETTAIVCAVNLSPRSRLRKQAPRDGLDRICAAAGLPFVRFRESEVYSVVEIEEHVFAAMRARIAPSKLDDIPAEEAAPMLHALSQAIDDGRPASRARSRQAVAERPRAPVPMTGAPTRPEPAPPSETPRRREPRIQDRQVLDDEPVFKIDLDADEDEPVRARRF